MRPIDIRLLFGLGLGLLLGIAGSVVAQSIGDTLVLRCVVEDIVTPIPSPTEISPAPSPTATALPPPTPSPSPSPPSTTTYYIRPDGNDANAGTSPSTAWRTVQRVNDHVFSPGESALFQRGGVWDASIVLDALDSGADGQPIRIGSYGDGVSPVIDCATSGCDFGVFLDGAQHVTVEDLTIRNAQRYGLYLQGDNGRGYTFQRLSVSKSTHYGMKLFNFNDSRIANNEVFDNGNAGVALILSAAADPSWTTKRITVSANIIQNNVGAGIHPHGEAGQVPTRHGEHHIYGNSVSGNGDGIYLHRTQFNRIFDNAIQANNNQTSAGEGDGIALSSDTHQNDVYDNTITGQRNHGVHLWGDFPSSTNPNWRGTSANAIYRNQIFAHGKHGILLSGKDNRGQVIAYNLVYENGGNGISAHDLPADRDGHRVINNTIVGNVAYGLRMAGDQAHTFHNNVLSGNGSSFTDGRMPNMLAGNGDVLANCYNEGIRYRGVNHADPSTADPQATTGNPLFVDPSNDNYRLRAGSPCLTAGSDAHRGDPFALDLDLVPTTSPPLRGAYSVAQ